MADQLPPPLQGRNLHTQQVSFLRLNISHKDKHLTEKIGILPRGAVITSIKAFVKTAFPEAKLKIGSTYGGNEYSEKEIKTQSVQDFTPTDQKAFVGDDKETTLYATRDKTTAAGECVVVVQFVTNH
ncbi:hypothetical protein [Bartonella krasnovii]|uniref:Putative genomic island protein n=1 Tax=Bartonella krasnovii TaxID=2267275 RepID=A0A5B9D154_9HYPH|nr:hypothetical protein [Bartonella krasnovii]QEE12276.1 putative genomic island protein [Bartonella krasnovii]UNF29786.1 hypothetical protein MNL13_03240 [Bartonella krasnovii]UNF36146.1 hypothetical protein MNL12_03235 [Bartonella krasnovii]UNF37801.1 hypothetical protein MNL11_03460 [Bartonella krasnovii]UNF37853.1 hypothetical protein MNL11_03765 [Bartonella krasnovii]